MRLVAGITATIAALLLLGIVVGAAERSVLVLAPSADDDRLDPAREALAFWNARLAELGVATRLGGPRVVVASPVARVLENYARGVAQRAVRLPGGEAEPDAPPELTRLAADVVLLLSRQDILSYTWPLPRVDPPRHLVVIRRVRGPDRNDAMVTRHVVAHELGHALGLLHNELADTLMCGPCQPLAAESDETGFLPLTDAERARLVALHGDPND
ncbi:MAG: matrixin family metalloprotease [Acidobacteria bacterium]|nr:matrixin family metalloprotease [Acidobacteriota bacterium]